MNKKLRLDELNKQNKTIDEMFEQGLTPFQKATISPLMTEMQLLSDELPDNDEDLTEEDMLRLEAVKTQIISKLSNG